MGRLPEPNPVSRPADLPTCQPADLPTCQASALTEPNGPPSRAESERIVEGVEEKPRKGGRRERMKEQRMKEERGNGGEDG